MTDATRPTLKLGDKSEAVKVWQTILGAKPDGIFGPVTAQMTRAWQAGKGLVADGVVGPATWAAAAAVPEAPKPAPVVPSGKQPRFIPAQRIPASIPEVYAALQKAWEKKLGAPGDKNSVCILLAQWAFETGRGKAMWNFNLGNQKGRPDGSDGRSWTFFACNEILPDKLAQSYLAKAGQRRDGGPGLDTVITSSSNGNSTVWFYPNHVACCFRAYDTLQEGADDYFDLIYKRFASCWPAVVAGDPAQFSHLLKKARYYTADESHYTRSLVSIYLEMKSKIA